MAKKKNRKKKKSGPISLSPKTYIKTKARQLPIHECLISENWEVSRLAVIVVTRTHKNGHISCGVYLIDMLCIGVTDTTFGFNMTEYEYEQFQEKFTELSSFEKCDYALAHNIIYGAVEFAQQYGLQPHREFWVTQYILEDSDADIEPMAIEFGEDGVPTVVTTLDEEPKHIIAQLEKVAGPDNYNVIYLDAVDFPDNYEDETEEDDDFLHEDPFEMIDELYEEKFGERSRPAMQPDNFELKEYKITFEAVRNPNYFCPEEDMSKVQKLYALASSGSSRKARKAISKLKALIEKFPNNPVYFNYLMNAYENFGDEEAAEQVCEYSYQRFPDYLFARCNYAQYLFRKKKIEQVPEVFDNKFELQSIYPDRDEFHIGEVVAFHSIMCRYFTAIDNLHTADVYGDLLKEFAEFDTPIKKMALFELRAKKYEKVFGIQTGASTDEDF